MGRDLPAWERDGLPKPDRRGNTPTGYLDYLTWQSRRIHLFPEPDGTVSVMQRMQALRPPEQGQLFDPFKCYRRVEEKGWDARNFDFDRALWRDAHALFETNEPSRQRPLIFNWLARIENLRRAGQADTPKAVRCSVIGLAANQAKVEFWRHETLPLPLVYLEEQQLVGKLRDALAVAEKIGQVLQEAAWSVSRQYLLPLAGNKKLGRGQKNDIKSLAKRLAPGRAFWPRLEVPFKRFLEDLADDMERNEQGVPVYGNRVLPEWARTLRGAARFAFTESVAQLGQDARALKARAVVEPSFEGKLFTELKPYVQEVTHA